ncbi:NAD(P)-dependent oxidoreductase [Streptomyces pluripotens]|uniref:NAD(P)-dependent oxidoreductase n=1 Tax=Streptomyces pluripotens TaxID=1355015 RepID=A0A221P6U5_9ACTN|nr:MULTISPECIES: NAD(P)-dependent oxidoreductase [Streptomyces]ARP73673.1 NarL family transcriptional regulator [Streptomyces pluripotens]ASN27920.1 NAD(P)-dependent oxidoreductase [Streptomyces pluripotens]KIE24367.1 NarL family transcriptional regulator [Streptomyces sp. MUSC 125]
MRILVLGGTGYLGRHVTEDLRALPGAQILAAGRSLAAGFRVDLATDRPEALTKTLTAAAPDVVVNCAGATGGNPVTLAEVNARGPAVLCAALREAAPTARLVHLGSAAEYGPGTPDVPVAEAAPACPVTPYGATKLAGTVAVTSAALDAVVLRVGNPVGPGAPAANLPGRMASLLRSAGPEPDAVLQLGDLSAYRDFVDVRDLARAVALTVTAPGHLPSVLNISGGTAVAVRELVHGLARRAGFRGRLQESTGGSARSARVSWQCSDITAAERALGWRPEHDLDDALDALWAVTARSGRLP